MFVVLEKVQVIKSKLSIEQMSHIGIAVILFVIVCMSLFAVFRPVSTAQLQRIHALAQQEHHAEAQLVAQYLTQKDEISVGQYLKLMHVYQYEAKRAQQLPPFITEQD